MITAIADPREVFPLAPEGTRTLHTDEPPSSAPTRPWVLRFARTPDATQAIVKPQAVYDNQLQMSVGLYDGPLPFMQTHTPTIPDGSVDNPPPLDEGPKD
ncbi:putative ATP-grasp-modified RiPP [Streptomyces sp. NPDC001880]